MCAASLNSIRNDLPETFATVVSRIQPHDPSAVPLSTLITYRHQAFRRIPLDLAARQKRNNPACDARNHRIDNMKKLPPPRFIALPVGRANGSEPIQAVSSS